MKKVLTAGLAACVTLTMSPHAAQADSGFELGDRLGYGIPIGDLEDEDNSELKGAISGQVPI